MKLNKLAISRTLLIIGGVYFLIGAAVHLFGLTLFPFYDGAMYVPYQDTVIALTAIILAVLLFTIAKDPIKNSDTYKVVLFSGILAVVFSIIIIFRVDGVTSIKRLQTLFEMILLMVYTASLWIFRPNKAK